MSKRLTAHEVAEKLRELVDHMVSAIIDDEYLEGLLVTVDTSNSTNIKVIILAPVSKCRGQIVGAQGSNIDAIRWLVKAAACGYSYRGRVQIELPEGRDLTAQLEKLSKKISSSPHVEQLHT